MDTIIRIMFYLVVGIALLLANIWFVRLVRNATSKADVIIVPFQVVGYPGEASQVGSTLAHMLHARLITIERDLKNAQERLIAPVAGPSAPATSIIPPLWNKPVDVPVVLLEPANVKVEVQGVEVGGIFTWMQRALAKKQTLSFSVFYSGDKAIVTGNLDPFVGSKSALWVEARADPVDITNKIAYTLIQKHLATDRTSKIEWLSADEFEMLLNTVFKAADLNHQVALGRPTKNDYAALLPGVESLALKSPRWYQLVYLTATIAESAENNQKALLYFRKLKELAENGGASGLDAKVKDGVNAKVTELTPGIPLGQSSLVDAAIDKIRKDAQYAVAFLNKLFGTNLDIPPIQLTDPSFQNAYWDGSRYNAPPQIQYLPDITYHEIALAYISRFRLSYQGQSGAIVQSYANVLASLIKQERLGQTAESADWVIAPGAISWLRGEDIPSSTNQSSLLSLKAPGSAYDDTLVGKDPQPANMAHYVNTKDDNGGVHINQGIPNKAFYETAIKIGSTKAGKIWLTALTQELSPNSDFEALAKATEAVASDLYGVGSPEQQAVRAAWKQVGLAPMPRTAKAHS